MTTATFRFSYARPDSDVFTLVTEGLEHATNEDESTCVTTGVSTITVTMSEDMDGARYMCYIKEADNEEFLDEVVVKLFRKLPHLPGVTREAIADTFSLVYYIIQCPP